MSGYENWIASAYDKNGNVIKKTWDAYLPREQKIYEAILSERLDKITTSIGELEKRFDVGAEFAYGFVDGISEALAEPISREDLEKLEEDTVFTLAFDFETLYKKMVEYKAEHLYNLPQWDNIFTPERRKEMFWEQKKSGTITKGSEPGRNDPCPCGSGKKYKKCCGAN